MVPREACQMATIYENIAVTLDGADENLTKLIAEYEASLANKTVSAKAKDLTHQICMSLRNCLDRIAFRYWSLKIAPNLGEGERSNAKSSVYFPAGATQQSMDATLGKWGWKHVKADHQQVYDYLLAQQPLSSRANAWLTVLFDLAVQGKHVDLVPQTRVESAPRITVSRGGGSVSWGPDVTFHGSGISVMGAPIDPNTQRIVPTPGVTEKIEVWVSFLIQGHNVDGASFCKEACRETRRIIQEMTDKFGLS